MLTVHCHLCPATLTLDAKTMDDQASELIASGWHDQYGQDGKLVYHCPGCFDKLGPMPTEAPQVLAEGQT